MGLLGLDFMQRALVAALVTGLAAPAVGTYLVCARAWSWEAVYVSLPVALLIALVLYVNQVPDREGDAAVGKRTLVVRITSSGPCMKRWCERLCPGM